MENRDSEVVLISGVGPVPYQAGFISVLEECFCLVLGCCCRRLNAFLTGPLQLFSLLQSISETTGDNAFIREPRVPTVDYLPRSHGRPATDSFRDSSRRNFQLAFWNTLSHSRARRSALFPRGCTGGFNWRIDGQYIAYRQLGQACPQSISRS